VFQEEGMSLYEIVCVSPISGIEPLDRFLVNLV
jgi:hypothetical protein